MAQYPKNWNPTICIPEVRNDLVRYSLTLKNANNNSGKKLLVLLQNPSKADDKISDGTINNVIKYVEKHSNNFNEIVIINIFPVRCGTLNRASVDICEAIKNEDYISYNNKIISCYLNKVDHVLLAYGRLENMKPNDRSHWITQLTNILEMIKKCKHLNLYAIYKLNKNGHPKHFAVQSINQIKDCAPNDLFVKIELDNANNISFQKPIHS